MPTMTIAEHFSYYGSLNGMKGRDIAKRSIYLVDLLQIPSAERPIERLSGGQQRRASLALSLLHSPPLLILDEPTVGIDPLLRNKIWKYLHHLTSQECKTVMWTVTICRHSLVNFPAGNPHHALYRGGTQRAHHCLDEIWTLVGRSEPRSTARPIPNVHYRRGVLEPVREGG